MNYDNHQPRYRNGICYWKSEQIKKKKKRERERERETTEGIEVHNQENIRTLGEKEN